MKVMSIRSLDCGVHLAHICIQVEDQDQDQVQDNDGD
jgi:hypothetical protein